MKGQPIDRTAPWDALRQIWTHQIPSPATESVDRLSDSPVLSVADDVVCLGHGKADDRQDGGEQGKETHVEIKFHDAGRVERGKDLKNEEGQTEHMYTFDFQHLCNCSQTDNKILSIVDIFVRRV